MQQGKPKLRVMLAEPRGFCAGVVRAIDIVERALALYGAPVYVRHEIVHNSHVVERLRGLGAVFVDELDEVPFGAVTVFSAHGVSRVVETEARQRDLDVIDATCPLVRRVHREGARYARLDYDVVLVGHAGHAEVEGTRGQIDGRLQVIGSVAEVDAIEVADPERVAYITQTTLSVTDTQQIIAALRRRFPTIVGPDTRDICYATQNRQKAVLALAARVQSILVLGSPTSSNASRLREIGESAGVPSRLVDRASCIEPGWLDGIERLGITAGASSPESLVEQALSRLATWREIEVETAGEPEQRIHFPVPDRLREAARRSQPDAATVGTTLR
jgi:4-hydroxy-3-methylbut-2-enyl diphosphate reductase